MDAFFTRASFHISDNLIWLGFILFTGHRCLFAVVNAELALAVCDLDIILMINEFIVHLSAPPRMVITGSCRRG